jgi:hypothetical protein
MLAEHRPKSASIFAGRAPAEIRVHHPKDWETVVGGSSSSSSSASPAALGLSPPPSLLAAGVHGERPAPAAAVPAEFLAEAEDAAREIESEIAALRAAASTCERRCCCAAGPAAPGAVASPKSGAGGPKSRKKAPRPRVVVPVVPTVDPGSDKDPGCFSTTAAAARKAPTAQSNDKGAAKPTPVRAPRLCHVFAPTASYGYARALDADGDAVVATTSAGWVLVFSAAALGSDPSPAHPIEPVLSARLSMSPLNACAINATAQTVCIGGDDGVVRVARLDNLSILESTLDEASHTVLGIGGSGGVGGGSGARDDAHTADPPIHALDVARDGAALAVARFGTVNVHLLQQQRAGDHKNLAGADNGGDWDRPETEPDAAESPNPARRSSQQQQQQLLLLSTVGLSVFPRSESLVRSVALHPSIPLVVAVATDEGTVHVWQMPVTTTTVQRGPATQQPFHIPSTTCFEEIDRSAPHAPRPATCVAWSDDGKTLFSAGRDGKIAARRWVDGKSTVRSLAIVAATSATAKTASNPGAANPGAANPGAANTANTAAGDPPATGSTSSTSSSSCIASIACGAAPTVLLGAAMDGRVHADLLCPDTAPWQAHEGACTAIAVLAATTATTRVASAGLDGSIKFWQLSNGIE